jgi:integrase
VNTQRLDWLSAPGFVCIGKREGRLDEYLPVVADEFERKSWPSPSWSPHARPLKCSVGCHIEALARRGNRAELDRTTRDVGDAMQFSENGANANQGIRTLRRMLGKAQEWKLLGVAPRLKLRPENGREAVIDRKTESKLLAHIGQPAKDVFTIIQDTGLRPDEVFRMTIENINRQMKTYFNESGKTKKARRTVPLRPATLTARHNGKEQAVQGRSN